MSKTYDETRGRVILSKDGKSEKPSILPESRYTDPEWVKEREDEGFGVAVDASQTHTYYQAELETLDEDFKELVPSEQERLDLINSALALKQQQFVRKQLLSKDFVPVEGSFDLHDVCGQVTERKTMSTQEKSANLLGKMLGRTVSLDELNALIETLKGNSVAA